MSDVRWAIYRDRYPFAAPQLIGDVRAPDKATALQRATALHGRPVLVQSAASAAIGTREIALPAPDPTRDAYGLKKRGYRRDAYRRKHQPRPSPDENAILRGTFDLERDADGNVTLTRISDETPSSRKRGHHEDQT